jgi:hypothetical protein
MTDAEDAAEKWWKEKMAEDVPNNDDLDDLAVAYLDGVERGKDAARARIAELEAALKDTTVCLLAAVSLLESGGKKAAPSNKMFDQMLVDYKNGVERARAAYRGEKE